MTCRILGLLRHRLSLAVTLVVSWFVCLVPVLAQDQSIYYRNFVRHSTGDFCTHVPPQAEFFAFLGNSPRQILTEQTPRFELGGSPNIDGRGTFGLELGCFADPPVHEGDTVTVVFTCAAFGEQGALQERVASIPWPRFPLTLQLRTVSLPQPPTDVQLTFGEMRERILRWSVEQGVRYFVFRRAVMDTVAGGKPRMLYRLQAKVASGEFVDTTTSATGHAYLLVPWRDGVWGPRSSEISDHPPAPKNVVAAVASVEPFQVSVSWEGVEAHVGVRFSVYRSTASRNLLRDENLLGQTEANYWLDTSVKEGERYFYQIVAVNAAGVRGPPSEVASVLVQRSERTRPDLDVLFISRWPKYPRFQVVYDPPGYNPRLDPAMEGQKHYPDPGERVTYTATIRNSGGARVESYVVRWYVDSALVSEELRGPLFPDQVGRSIFSLAWSDTPRWIECEVVGPDSIREITERNNRVRIRSNGLSFHFYVEQGIYDLFDSTKNPMGSFSFEDWAQVQLSQLNRFFAQARYPGICPDGVPEHVYLDTVSYYEDGHLAAGGTHAPQSLLWDGQWGFATSEQSIRYFRDQVLARDGGIDWALLHELGHQIGLIDLYRMDVAEPQVRVIEPRTGRHPELRRIAWDVVYYCSRKDYLMHTNFRAGLSDHSAGALLRNLGKRRGFYGEYLADIPRENALEIVRPDGSPVSDAEIWIYQKQDDVIPNVPKFRGWTDSAGMFWFPHHTDTRYEGGIYVRNPFSTRYSYAPHVVGTNSTLFIRIAKGDSVGYAFIDVCPFNVAYWSGKRDSATYRLVIEQWHLLPVSGAALGTPRETQRRYPISAHPNPFNTSVTIRYRVVRAGPVELAVFDARGRRVRLLTDGLAKPGVHRHVWDGRDDRGESLPSGVYFARLRTRRVCRVVKLMLLR